MIYIETARPDEVVIEEKEVLRYLGYGKNRPEPHVMEKIRGVSREVAGCVAPRACCTVLPVRVQEGQVDFGSFCAETRALAKNLTGCDRVLLFAATVGADVDRVITKYASLSPSSAVIAQAAGAAAIESWCDLLVTRISEKLKKENAFLRPRFSPGYGDFDLNYQRDLFQLLDVSRRIGVSLTEGGLMTPSKSVTAVAGVSSSDEECSASGCEVCEKRTECSYARG